MTFAKPDAGDRIIAVARNTERDMEEAVDAADSAPSAESADSADQARADVPQKVTLATLLRTQRRTR